MTNQEDSLIMATGYMFNLNNIKIMGIKILYLNTYIFKMFIEILLHTFLQATAN